MDCLIVAGFLTVAAAAGVIITRTNYRRWVPRRPTRTPASVVCVRCHGSGWIAQRERTLEFTGDGFTDLQHPSTMCAACGGSGQAFR